MNHFNFGSFSILKYKVKLCVQKLNSESLGKQLLFGLAQFGEIVSLKIILNPCHGSSKIIIVYCVVKW